MATCAMFKEKYTMLPRVLLQRAREERKRYDGFLGVILKPHLLLTQNPSQGERDGESTP